MTQLLAGTHGSLRAADSARGRRGSRLRARLGGLLLAVLVGDAGHAVPGEVCHLQGQGDWGPIDAYTGSVSGCVDLGPDDHVVIDAGAEVRTVDDLRMDGVTPGLTLQVHGAWIVDSADRRGGAGPLRVAVNGNAFVGVSSSVGARVEALGRVLAWGIDHTAVPVYVESPATSPGSYASVGAVVPCPDLAGQEDCAGSGSGRPERLRITRPAEPLWTSYLARVTTGHRLCFFTPDDRRFTPPSQAGFCFEIVEVGATHLDIDVRRSAGVDESSYPDALRQHALTQLAATLATGERCFTTADVIAADGERVGQWVQLESAGGPGPPQLVSVAEDEVAPGVDRFCAADALGVASAHGAGERVWFGWGVESGDPFWIDAPIVFESATGGDCDATVRFLGDVSLRGVSFRRHGGVSVIGPGTTLSGCERLWVYAKRSPRGAQFLWQDLDTVSCRWMAASTAGDRMPECAVGGTPVDPDVHGLECRNCRSFGVEDLGSAFGVDDLVYASTSGAAPGPAFVAGERWNLSPMGSPAFSGQLLDARQGGGARNVAVADVACARCSSCDGSGVLFLGSTHPGAIAWQVDRIAAIGTCGGFESTSGASKLEVRDATVVDARPGVGALLPDRVIGGVVRGTRSSQANSWLSIGGVERSDLLVVDHDLATPALWSLAPAEELENVLVADLRCSSRSGAGGCAVLGDAGIPAHGAALRRVSLVQTPGLPSAGATHQLLLAALPLGAQIGGLLFYGFGGPDVVAASDFGNAAAMADPARFTWQEPLCHWANLPVGPAADNLAAYQSGAVPGVFADPELADPGSGDFEPVAGGVADAAPCGIAGGVSGPGVRGRSWALGLAGLKPEFVGGSLTECGNGLDDDGDGRTDHEDPGCSDARDASERPRRRCGLGFEAAPVLAVLAAGWRRRPRA